MERDFYTDEFEELIKLKADQYRMYPSDKVWKGVKRSLHSNKRKYWFGFALLLTGLSYFGIDQLIVSPPAKQVMKPTPDNAPPSKQQARIIPFDQVIPKAVNDKAHSLVSAPTRSAIPPDVLRAPSTNTVKPSMVVTEAPADIDFEPTTAPLTSILEIEDFEARRTTAGALSPADLEKPVTQLLTRGLSSQQQEKQQMEDIKKINWLQEFAVYELTPSSPRRINWQIAFAPTMTYRRLIGRNNANIQSNAGNIPIALSIGGDVDNLVKHKPALGFELGSYLVYSLSQNLAVKAGFQFNYSRYAIQAYSSATERATISLNSINGLSTSSISNYTQLRNYGGYAVQDLQNQYFQVSIPVGVELNLLGTNKLQLGVAGTVQPTYLLNRNTYLISSDFKNYTREPSLLRKWNLNTSAEAFVSYKTAGLKWQVGPQVRYQLFSSYTDKYPIKEYLIEYGVKIGVTKTIR